MKRGPSWRSRFRRDDKDIWVHGRCEGLQVSRRAMALPELEFREEVGGGDSSGVRRTIKL